MQKTFVIIAIIFALLALWYLTRFPKTVHGGGKPTDQFVSMCPPGYMPTGSGCVTADETIGMGPHP
jgi:hypothetical protein